MSRCDIVIASYQDADGLMHIKCITHDIMLSLDIPQLRIDKEVHKIYTSMCKYLRQQGKKAVKQSKNTIHECDIKCADNQVYCDKHHISIAPLKDNYDRLRMEQDLFESAEMRDHCALMCNIRRSS